MPAADLRSAIVPRPRRKAAATVTDPALGEKALARLVGAIEDAAEPAYDLIPARIVVRSSTAPR